MAQIHLAPIQPALGVNPTYCLPKQTTLIMKEKVWSLSGDTFHIVDENNVEVVRCQGTTFSLSDRKEFQDSAGRPLFSLRNKLIAIHKTFYAEAPDGKILFEVKSKFSIGKAKMVVTFQNLASNNANIELYIRGDWIDKSATITVGDGGAVIAQISRKIFNAREILGGQQTYYCTVAPGVDVAMVAALCVCLDEKENEKK